jgi:hypothetical protein
MMVRGAVERPDKLGDLGPHPPVGQLGELLRLALSGGDQGLDYDPARLGQRRRRDRPQASFAASSRVISAATRPWLRVRSWMSRLR